MRGVIYAAALLCFGAILGKNGRVVAVGNTMETGGIVEAPKAAAKFCLRQPMECTPSRGSLLGEWPMEQLFEVNYAVNDEVAPAEDIDLHGISDVWSIPNGRGDCEDVALLKRKRLIAMGWPSSVLLMTVVRDERGEGHAVLTVALPAIDLILDNRGSVLIWHAAPYEFVQRQSRVSPQIWVEIKGGSRHAS